MLPNCRDAIPFMVFMIAVPLPLELCIEQPYLGSLTVSIHSFNNIFKQLLFARFSVGPAFEKHIAKSRETALN